MRGGGVGRCVFPNLATEAAESDVFVQRNLPLAGERVSSASQPASQPPVTCQSVLCPCGTALMQPVAVHCSAVCITSAAAGVGCAARCVSLVTRQALRCNSRLTQLREQASERTRSPTQPFFSKCNRREENMIFFLCIDGCEGLSSNTMKGGKEKFFMC